MISQPITNLSIFPGSGDCDYCRHVGSGLRIAASLGSSRLMCHNCLAELLRGWDSARGVCRVCESVVGTGIGVRGSLVCFGCREQIQQRVEAQVKRERYG